MPAKKKIRKDAGDLTKADLEFAPVWEFCVDEEDVEGQTECTVRPLVGAKRFDPVECSGIVVADFAGPKGFAAIGIVDPAEEFEGPWVADPQLFLDRPIEEVVSDPVLSGYSRFMCGEGRRMGFALPWPAHEPIEIIAKKIPLAYRVIGREASSLFPLVCTPRVRMDGWPESFKIDGFLRPVDLGGRKFEVVH